MKKETTNYYLKAFLRLSETPEKYLSEYSFTADKFLTLAALLFCFPIYEYFAKDEISFLGDFSFFGSGLLVGISLLIKLSIPTLRLMAPFLKPEALKEKIDENET